MFNPEKRRDRIPKVKELDATFALLREGYDFGANRFRASRSDVFETRVLGRRAVWMAGPDATRFFYAGDGAFTRVGAVPPTTLRLLQGKPSVQQLDGDAHRWRKKLFMSLLKPESVSATARDFERAWRSALVTWTRERRVVLHDVVCRLLADVAARWIGLPAREDIGARLEEARAMVDASASFGWPAARALWLRRRSERWARNLIRAVRCRAVVAPAETPLYAIAHHRDETAALLPLDVAAVELINLFRPIVALGRFVVFGAHALNEHRELRAPIADGDPEALARFVLEVRRYYPLFPAATGRARRDLVFRGFRIPKGRLVALDLYATNHDERVFADPSAFRPERFATERSSAIVAQGGGNPHRDHRCPGEDMTAILAAKGVELLCTTMHYTVPRQDLMVDRTRMPALPGSGFVIGEVVPIPDAIWELEGAPITERAPAPVH